MRHVHDPEESDEVADEHSQHGRREVEVKERGQCQVAPVGEQNAFVHLEKILRRLIVRLSLEDGQEVKTEGNKHRREHESLQEELEDSSELDIGHDSVDELVEEVSGGSRDESTEGGVGED